MERGETRSRAGSGSFSAGAKAGGSVVPPAASNPLGAEAEELPGWDGRGGAPPVGRLATLTEYEEGWPYPVAFAPQRPEVTLSKVIAREGARQHSRPA